MPGGLNFDLPIISIQCRILSDLAIPQESYIIKQASYYVLLPGRATIGLQLCHQQCAMCYQVIEAHSGI